MNGSRTGERRWWWALGGVMVVGLGVRVVYVLVVASRTELRADATWYLLQAGIIGSGEGYLDPEAYFGRGQAVATSNFPPLWPVLLSMFERLGVGGEQTYRLVGAGVGAVTVALTGLVGRQVAGRRVGLVAAALVACSPLLVAADGSLMSESLYVMLVTATVGATYRARQRPSIASVALVGLLGGLAVLTRSDGAVLVPMLIAVAVVSVPVPISRRVALGAVGLAVSLAVVAPWSVRNTLRLDQGVALTTNVGSVLEGANCPTTYGGELLGAWDPACLRETRRLGLTEGQWANAGQTKGIDYATNHLERWPMVAATRLARAFGVWNPVDAARLEAVENRHERWQLGGWFWGAATMALALPGAVLLVRRRADLWPLAAVVVGVAVSVLLAWGNQRFRLAAEPMIAIAAATAVTGWTSAFASFGDG